MISRSTKRGTLLPVLPAAAIGSEKAEECKGAWIPAANAVCQRIAAPPTSKKHGRPEGRPVLPSYADGSAKEANTLLFASFGFGLRFRR